MSLSLLIVQQLGVSLATASVTYTFTASTYARASEVNTNFSDVVTFLNTHCLHKDGAIAMTGALTLSGDPTSTLHAATKQYVDARANTSWMSGGSMTSKSLSSTTYSDWGSAITITNPGTAVKVLAVVAGDARLNGGENAKIQLMVSFDGGSTWTSNEAVGYNTNTSSMYCTLSTNQYKTGTPSGDIWVKCQAATYSGGGSGSQMTNGRIAVFAIKSS